MSETPEVEPERPANPLLVPLREESVTLYRSDVAERLDGLELKLDELSAEIAEAEERADQGGGPPKRMGKASPLAKKREERRKGAKEYDDLAASPSSTMLFREPTFDAYNEVLNEHPPREGDRLDQMRGWNGETFPAALAHLCLVEPVVTDEQWAEFVRSASAYNWRHKVMQTVFGLTDTEPDLPKPFAVSVVARMDARSSKRQPATESPRDDSKA